MTILDLTDMLLISGPLLADLILNYNITCLLSIRCTSIQINVRPLPYSLSSSKMSRYKYMTQAQGFKINIKSLMPLGRNYPSFYGM